MADERAQPEEAPRPASPAPRRPAHRPEVPQAPSRLDARAQALAALLQEALQPYAPEMGAAVDQPVVKVPLQHLLDAARTLKEDPRLDFSYFRCLATVDYQQHFELAYLLYSIAHRHQVILKTTCPAEAPVAPTLIPLWPAANWHERESHDLFGVLFEGHPNMKPLLLYEGFEGHPGRKGYPLNEYQDW